MIVLDSPTLEFSVKNLFSTSPNGVLVGRCKIHHHLVLVWREIRKGIVSVLIILVIFLPPQEQLRRRNWHGIAGALSETVFPARHRRNEENGLDFYGEPRLRRPDARKRHEKIIAGGPLFFFFF